MQRSEGTARIAFKTRGDATVLDDLYQAGSAKVRFPREGLGPVKDAVLINTTGGIADGDRFTVTVACGPGTQALVTSQAAERVYKAVDRDNPAALSTRLLVAADATLMWLPQETMLFDGGAVRRTLDLDVAETGSTVMAESYVIGRTAMGERVGVARLFDRWTVRHGGKLVFADSLKLDGDITTLLAEPVVTGGATVFATLLYVGTDAPHRLDALRDVVAGVPANAACSLRAPVLAVRMIAADVIQLHRSLIAVAAHLSPCPDHVAARLGRQWLC